MIAKRHTLANALRVAADQYDADARTARTATGFRTREGHERTIAQFERQAGEARKLAEAIEQAGTIELED